MANLNSFQKKQSELEKKYGKDTPAYHQALTQLYADTFGPISEDTLPPGSTVTFRSADNATIVYTDADGFSHKLVRQTDASKANFGQLLPEETNRPAVVVPKEATTLQNQLLTNLTQSTSTPFGLAGLDPEAQAALAAFNKAAETSQNQQFQSQSGDLVAQLYGRGVNQSTLANDAAARLTQQQGLVDQQREADAASRELALRQFLTTAGQNQQSLNQNLALGLVGNNTQAQTASGQINLQQQQLNAAIQQFYQTLQLERDKYEQAQRSNLLSSILTGGISALLNPGSDGSGILNSIFKNSSLGTTPASQSGINNLFSGSQYQTIGQLGSLFPL